MMIKLAFESSFGNYYKLSDVRDVLGIDINIIREHARKKDIDAIKVKENGLVYIREDGVKFLRDKYRVDLEYLAIDNVGIEFKEDKRMAKYRKKPVIVEAKIYEKGMEDGFEKSSNQCTYCQDSCSSCPLYKPYISTLEGKLYIDEGDYIITGVKGERYPCKPDIFEMTYELVE